MSLICIIASSAFTTVSKIACRLDARSTCAGHKTARSRSNPSPQLRQRPWRTRRRITGPSIRGGQAFGAEKKQIRIKNMRGVKMRLAIQIAEKAYVDGAIFSPSVQKPAHRLGRLQTCLGVFNLHGFCQGHRPQGPHQERPSERNRSADLAAGGLHLVDAIVQMHRSSRAMAKMGHTASKRPRTESGRKRAFGGARKARGQCARGDIGL